MTGSTTALEFYSKELKLNLNINQLSLSLSFYRKDEYEYVAKETRTCIAPIAPPQPLFPSYCALHFRSTTPPPMDMEDMGGALAK